MPTPALKRRLVAIVGRPNVGKSAIFNRLAGAPIAIVHADRGVTRDRLMCEVAWQRHAFDLVDTGGIGAADGATIRDEIEAGIRRQVDAALADAAVAVLVVDIAAGAAPMDEEVAGLLRASGCLALVAANKADRADQDAGADEFRRFGFPVFPISALHNRGFDALMAAVVAALPDAPNPTLRDPLRVVVAGRPNVGKSSFINRLIRDERVIVSPAPGTTRDSIDIPFVLGQGAHARHYVLTDTAGIRRVSKVDTTLERFSVVSAERSISRADVVALLLDAERGPTAQDKRIAAIIREQQKGCVVVVNKWDLARGSERECGEAVHRFMPFMAFCPIAFVSAKSGYNIRHSIEAMDHVAAQVRARLPTGVLNRTLLDAAERVQARLISGRRLKIFYATQVGCGPVRIRFFVNDPRLVPPPYREYLTRCIRERFGLEGAPLVLQFTARTRRASPPPAGRGGIAAPHPATPAAGGGSS